MHHGNLELGSELRQSGAEAYYEEAEKRRHLEPFAHRKVYFHVRETPEESEYRVRDEGPGFDVAKVAYDPTDPMHLESPSGRGLFLMRMFMDDVRYNERGNEITMVHRRGMTEQKELSPPSA